MHEPTSELADTSIVGLTSAEVARRQARGEVNTLSDKPTRTVGEIVRANVFTRFNFIITALLVVILIFGEINDALFGLVMVGNSIIGIVQELRAKQTLDRLTLLTEPKVTVVRDGVEHTIRSDGVVLDETVLLSTGDQVVADGTILQSQGLEIDEALLTGESDPIDKNPGDRCLSGSFVVAGSGSFKVDAVGQAAYAAKLTSEAREFKLVGSELMGGIDWVLKMITFILPPTIGLLVWSQVNADQSFAEAMSGAVAGGVAAVPQGLVLLTSIAFGVGVIRLGQQSVLMRELAAVEGLARVDTVCFDKTGTLTAGQLEVRSIDPQPGIAEERVAEILGAMVATDQSPNATLLAIASVFDKRPDWYPNEVVPFSSSRKWSGVDFGTRGIYVLGAPEIVAKGHTDVLRAAETMASSGLRVLVIAQADSLDSEGPLNSTKPLATIAVGDEIRHEASDTLDYFESQGVQAKVISGDHPRTVAAVARAVGMEGADRIVDGATLPDDQKELAKVVEESNVFGRVTPQQKRRMVRALQANGHRVAMTGDGVNDALALKDADIGVAMGSGSSATRAVADVVLLKSDFSALPEVVDEGRRAAANVERVANLFLTKTVYAFLFAIAVAFAQIAFPFLPRHMTLVGSLTIGIPAFFLALERQAPPARSGFIARTLRFAIPTGIVAAAASFGAYLLAQDEGVSLIEGRTIATIVLGAVGTMALAMVCRPLTPLRRTVLGGVVAGFVLAFLIPFTREFFALDMPRPVVLLAAAGVIAITGALLWFGLRFSGWASRHSISDLEHLADELTVESKRLWHRVEDWIQNRNR